MADFPALQAAYARYNIATYPLRADKTPAVSGYNRIGAPYSAKLATKFPDARAAGFVAGWRNKLTIIDIDSTDDRLVEEIQNRIGRTPVQVRTPSGGRHLYFRHCGEGRRIKALPDVDILGGGNVVAALSVVPKGSYSLERGSLADLDRLPPLRGMAGFHEQSTKVPEGRRNTTLLYYCHSIFNHCDTLDDLIDAARTWAANWLEKGVRPVSDPEIVKTANNVWRFRRGTKRVMQNIVEGPIFSELAKDSALLGVFAYLSAENGPNAEFMFADGLAEARGWPRRLVPYARNRMLELNVIGCVRHPARGRPGLYRWLIDADDARVRPTKAGM